MIWVGVAGCGGDSGSGGGVGVCSVRGQVKGAGRRGKIG